MARGWRGHDHHGDAVLPAPADEDQYSPLDKPVRETSSSVRTLRPFRCSISFFIFLNLVGICSFIFSSAFFFPSANTAGVVKQAIKQGDLSILEPAPADSTIHRESEDLSLSIKKSESPKEEVEGNADEIRTTTSTPPQPVPSEQTPVVRNESPSLETVEPSNKPTESPPPPSPSAFVSPAPATSSPPSITPMTTPVVKSIAEILKKLKSETKSPVTSSPAPEPTTTPPITTSPSPAPTTETPTSTPPPVTFPVETPTHSDTTQNEAVATMPTLDLDLEDKMVLWLSADRGVEVASQADCEMHGTSCGVKAWKSRLAAMPVEFHPTSNQHYPQWQPNASKGRPSISFNCPMVTEDLLLHDFMTLFFVFAPDQVKEGDTYTGQKFFGNAPYGQFLLHGGKPAFYSTGGLREIDSAIPNGDFAVLVYRLNHGDLQIKNGEQVWSSTTTQTPSSGIRFSGNREVTLGNVKRDCDFNAFQGRIGEVLMFNTALSDSESSQVETYLLSKWTGRRSVLTEAPEIETQSPISEPATVEIPASQDPQTPSEKEVVTKSPPNTQEMQTHDPASDAVNPYPAEASLRHFESEGVFEWTPSKELLTLIAKTKDVTSLQAQWKEAVSERIAAIRSFQIGGEALRTFIRRHRDELIDIRQDLFG
ncbi:hypothetical protein Poli38472_001531 [Pythium oligandrum]|uniref:Uncharacterized protein n=1 Tax=Pythium oligandrum TaxID=41045 RepID=A0A8K1FMH6_PYTOL|nr:hypothetical protein Poli38472_001531 [Pythium oligandrum]|eukprot:TMW69375.1 hypothetical protein Poli38472_001531 [Pythium oligandrum]